MQKEKICKRLINLNAIKKVIASDDFEQNYNDLNVTECHNNFNTKNEDI